MQAVPPTQGYGFFDVQIFVVSENCFVATDRRGIWLYHQPRTGGRKGMSIETGWQDEFVINTGVLGIPDTRHQYRASMKVPGLGGI